MSQPSQPTLADLRVEIDRIDAQMHALLMERGRVIDRLIEIKARQGGGSAFRPAREASMMRAIVERHEGRLPLDTVESIWRVIISTFTYVQAPYSVHVDVSRGDAAMRDSARFHFGFTVPCVPHFGAAEVIRAVAEFGRRPRHVRRRRRPGGRRLVDETRAPRKRRRSSRGCLSSSAPTIRRACRCSSSRSHWSTGGARGRARVGDARSLAPGHPWRSARDRRRSDRLGGRWNGACASRRAAGRDRAGCGERRAAVGRRGRRARLEVGAHADRFDVSTLRKGAN